MYKNEKNQHYQHNTNQTSGFLLVNLGSPEQATHRDIRRYLKEFLSDRRVIEVPKIIWIFILQLFILPLRPFIVAKKYREIWLAEGSPLLVYSQRLTDKVQKQLTDSAQTVLAMRYGKPSIKAAMQQFKQQHIKQLTILPLYPQYSATTTATTFDAIAEQLKTWRYMPQINFINQYADHPQYISILAQHIKNYWQQHQRGKILLMSFHGLPKRNLTLGDPYYCYCHKTARLIAEALELKDDQYRLVFQSRFGKAEWLQPYCEATLQQLAKQGIKHVDVICPGFPVDCLETLEEIAETYKESFIAAGGKNLSYIPALNDNDSQADFISQLYREYAHD